MYCCPHASLRIVNAFLTLILATVLFQDHPSASRNSDGPNSCLIPKGKCVFNSAFERDMVCGVGDVRTVGNPAGDGCEEWVQRIQPAVGSVGVGEDIVHGHGHVALEARHDGTHTE
eukprot:m.733742 g.733742  ORF g.733742 m.733742 type:complete len:116 (-) comp23074_c0_seq5:894-1241(-)